MSLEAVQKVTEAEQRSRERRAEAVESAKRLVAEAEKDGKARLSAARSEAEAKAARHTQAVMEDQRKSCDGLRREAEAKLDEAAAMIVRRVVGV